VTAWTSRNVRRPCMHWASRTEHGCIVLLAGCTLHLAVWRIAGTLHSTAVSSNVAESALGGTVTGHGHTAWGRRVSCQHNPQHQHSTQNRIANTVHVTVTWQVAVTSLTHSHQSAPHNYQAQTRSPHPLLSSPWCTSHGRPASRRSCHTHTDASARLG
jgi:hypothetical protein